MKFQGVFVLLGIFIISCNPAKNVVPNKTNMIVYESKSCYGRCPIFKVKISFVKNVKFEGIKDSKKIGVFDFQISKKEFEEIKNLVLKLNLEKLENKYTSKTTDLHLRILELNNLKQEKKILLFDNVPSEISKLEMLLNKLLKKYEML